MTEKRFTLAYADYDWWAICDKENPTEQGISGEDVVKLLNEFYEEKIQICNYIQTRLNECKNGELRRFVNEAFLCEEGSGYIGALLDIKKGLIKRRLWEITINEHESTKIDTTRWKK